MDSRSPFLEVRSFAAREFNPPQLPENPPPESPFLSRYLTDTGEAAADPRQAEYALFFNDLYDEAFERALGELASEATDRYDAIQSEAAFGDVDDARAERMLEQHFAPLVAETHRMLDTLAAEFSQRGGQRPTEAEVDEIVDRYQPAAALEPAFEEFFGKLKNAVTKIAKKGLSLASTLGLGPILQKLKPLVKPLIKRVIQFAIGKLPPKLQPLARKLAEKLPMLNEARDEGEHLLEHAESCELAQMQLEFNANVANLLFAPDEATMDSEVAEILAAEREDSPNFTAELDQARERLTERLQGLREGEDPAPYIQEFIPAILPVLKLGISIAGRPNVVKFLAKLVAPLIQNLVGPQFAPQLSQAIVDAGLKLVQLEAGEPGESGAAAAAVAATVEDTVRRVASLSEAEQEDPELFEAAVVRAFEQAAAANLPAVLPEGVYRKRPELAEGRGLRGTWVALPEGRRKRYKRFTRAVPVRLAPHKVDSVETTGGETLGEAMEEGFGIQPGEEVDAVVHLYEAIAGGRLDEAADGADLHPLTREAAETLLGEADMGRDESAAADSHAAFPGQRFYSLEIAGKRSLATPGAQGASQRRRRTQVRLALDFQRGVIRIHFFLSEIRAQEIAVKLRQNAHVGLVAATLGTILERGLRASLSGAFGRLKIVHESVAPTQWRAAMERLPSFVKGMLLGKLREWSVKSLLKYLKENTAAYIKATEDTADGITIAMSIADPPGFAQLRVALSGKGLSLGSFKFSDGKPKVDVKFHAGFADA